MLREKGHKITVSVVEMSRRVGDVMQVQKHLTVGESAAKRISEKVSLRVKANY